jgi:hypothetical protein
MQKSKRVLIAIVAAIVVGGGFMAFDKWRGAEWEVSPQQIETAKANGQPGFESRPGTVTVLPIRSETADVLPIKWGMAGLMAGLLALRATGKRREAKA